MSNNHPEIKALKQFHRHQAIKDNQHFNAFQNKTLQGRASTRIPIQRHGDVTKEITYLQNLIHSFKGQALTATLMLAKPIYQALPYT